MTSRRSSSTPSTGRPKRSRRARPAEPPRITGRVRRALPPPDPTGHHPPQDLKLSQFRFSTTYLAGSWQHHITSVHHDAGLDHPGRRTAAAGELSPAVPTTRTTESMDDNILEMRSITKT